MKLLTKLFSHRIRRSERRLSEDELMAVFCNSEEPPAIYQAVLQVLEDHIEDATLIASDIKTAQNSSVLAHCAGGLDALRRFRDDLNGRRENIAKT